MAEPVTGKALRRALMILWKAESSQLVWKNRTASLLLEQRVRDIASPYAHAKKAPIGTPQRELPSATRIRL